jgi:hypothetical protein
MKSGACGLLTRCGNTKQANNQIDLYFTETILDSILEDAFENVMVEYSKNLGLQTEINLGSG